MFFRALISFAFLILLAGCKADNLQLKISSSELQQALAGEVIDVPFSATFSSFGELDAEKRSQLKSVEKIARDFLAIDVFDVTVSDSKVEIVVEGTLPLVSAANERLSADSPWRILIGESDLELAEFEYRLALVSTSDFDAMENDMEDINFMTSPDEFNPTQIRLRANSGSDLRLLVGGVQMDGDHFGLQSVTVPDGETVTMNFVGGVYDETGATFLLSGLR